jgi:large subunit ribosomal protein L21
MYAVVEIAGTQFEVRPNEIIRVPLLGGNIGDAISFDKVLLGGSEGNVNIGTPYISGKVDAKILAHGKDVKVIVFKKKRRKGYRKLNGHRQRFTKIEITNINFN